MNYTSRRWNCSPALRPWCHCHASCGFLSRHVTKFFAARLLSTAALAKAYGAVPLTNSDALLTLDNLQALLQVTWRDEPLGVLGLWRTMAGLDSTSPKVWMDAYLAAFAIAAGLRLVTMDKDLNNFLLQGLDLALLSN